jgi:hypothetical protein
MKRRYPGGADFVAEVTSGARRFELVFTPDRLGVEEKASERAVVRAGAGDQEALFDVFFRGVPSAALERRGALTVTGDRARWADVLRAFAPPAGPSGGSPGKRVSGRA